MTKFVQGKVVFFLLCFFLCTGCKGNQIEYVHNTEYFSTEKVQNTESEPVYVVIHVCGAVNEPGVYTLPEGARVYDAILQACGFTEDACETYWNMAKLLEDGQMIYVPTEEEVIQKVMTECEAEDGRVNINTADCALLMTIPGIGETRALQIIAYREQNGAFSSTEEIMNVAGIKEAMFAKIKDYIRTE